MNQSRSSRSMAGAVLMAALLSGCGNQSSVPTSRTQVPQAHAPNTQAPQTQDLETAAAPSPASVYVDVSVPQSLRSAPFDVTRQLKVPPGFAVSVYARIPKARFMAVAPNGDLLVSQPSTGSILRVRDGAVSTFASGLSEPHDMVFATLGGTTYLYVSESNKVTRSVYGAGDSTRRAAQTVVSGLPDSSTPELRGAYAHALKNIALDGQGKLYVSVASATNADPSDVLSSFKRAAVYQYNADGSGGRLYAQGLRNAEGLAIRPGTSELWVTVNNRDNVAYPFHRDWDGDGSDDYGKVIQSYVDNHPPELFTKVRDGGNYGWPYCNPNPDGGFSNMPLDRDVQNNADGSKLDCGAVDRVSKGIQAHSAPLGLSFLQNSAVPEAYRGGAVMALHGCWNCSRLIGHQVSFFPIGSDGTPGNELTLVSGWITDAAAKTRWGRPVDVVPDQAGNLLISDDYAGAIYRLSPTAPSGLGVQSLTLVNADTGQPVPGFDPIPAGASLSRSALPARFSLRANTGSDGIGSVRFSLDGVNVKTENYAPYAIAGDSGVRADGSVSYAAWTPENGQHTVVAQPYSAGNAGGSAGNSYSLSFNVTQ